MSITVKSGHEGLENEDDNFVWQDYLDMTNTVEVPQVLFSHVELSLQTGLQEGMMLEVPHKSTLDSYWIACINMVCGPLLRLRYIGQEDNRSNDFWCDLTKVNVHPLGWCFSEGLDLIPPLELKEKLGDVKTLIDRVFQQGKSVPSELLTGDGFTPVDRIKQGMKIEVQDKMDPYHLWFATIIENVGGRLLLRHDSPDSSSPDFWLFYNSPRLFRIGWTEEQGSPFILKKPSYIKTTHNYEEWEAIKELALGDATQIPLPPDIFQNTIPATSHNFEVGMKLEAVHPHNMAEICPATVVKVFDSSYFLVEVDSNNSSDVGDIESSWLCTAQHPYIFPIGWAQYHGLQLTHPSGWTTSKEEFDWQEYLSFTNGYPAPAPCFTPRPSATELGFDIGMKLEAVNPENQHQICAASITRIVDNLLWIHLDSHDSFHPSHVVSMDSVDIFPVGWCESNSYPLKPPCQYQSQMKRQQVKEQSPKKEPVSSTSVAQRSCWCPKIYFNHKCFSGPFLSKGKLAQLPKAVGPGPVTLVMREVLGMLISVAYKSSRVLKELQCDGKPEAGMHLEVLKAKYKNNTYRASVAVVTSADQVPAFCKSVCTRLQVCPFMFGPVSIGENNCPENCNTLSKTRFTQYWVQGKRKIGRPKGEASNIVPRPKKKRGRKRLFQTAKQDNKNNKDSENTEKQMSEVSKNNQGEHSFSLENENKQDLSNSNSSSSPLRSLESTTTVVRRKYRKKEFPRTAMKTRGAKLPNFALQIKASHWPHKRLVQATNDPQTKTDKGQDMPLSSSESGDLHEDLQQDAKSEPMESSSIPEDLPPRRTLPADFVELESNPLYWSEDDVYQYLMRTEDCAWIAQKCKEELIDGQAFMMLNLPTLKEHLFLKTTAALKLCNHIERIKLAYYLQYVADSEP
ncbi:Polycomb protein Sfmbt [Gryllus bimaculatus]|nr:Polycomb protein Sfmbt [Gryllus bimaculatus]